MDLKAKNWGNLHDLLKFVRGAAGENTLRMQRQLPRRWRSHLRGSPSPTTPRRRTCAGVDKIRVDGGVRPWIQA